MYGKFNVRLTSENTNIPSGTKGYLFYLLLKAVALEIIKIPHQILIASSPNDADFAFVSIDDEGNLGRLNNYVLTQYGYNVEEDLPSADLLKRNGFAVIEATRSKPIIFVVTLERNRSTHYSLERNLYSALSTTVERIRDKKVWFPLMGTGDGGLSLLESYEITAKVINRFSNNFTNQFSLTIAFPDSEDAKQLRNQLAHSSQNENAADFLRKLNTNFFLAGAFWSGEDQVERFFEEKIWEKGQKDNSYSDTIYSIKKNDIIILKSAFSSNAESILRVKGFGIVTHISEDGASIEVDWRIRDINLDIPILGKYRRTIALTAFDDVLKIFSFLDPSQWQRLLPAPHNLPSNTERIAGLVSDSEKGNDHLGIDKDIKAFARVIAAKSFEPPLAIALFGKWGSGKSFFMRKLREQIEDFSEREARGMYCKGVVHIHFNAWSYMDANLWASFVSRIFEGLQEYIKSEKLGEEKEKNIKMALSEELNVTKSNIDTLKEKKEVVQKQIEALEKKQKDAQNFVIDKINELKSRTAWDIVKKIDQNFNAREQIQEALKENDSYVKTEEELRKIIPEKYWNNPKEAYEQAKSKYTFLKEFFKCKNIAKNIIWLTGILLVIFFLPGLLELLGITISKVNLNLPQSVLAFLATLGFIWRQAETVYRKLQPVLASFWKIKENYEQEREKALASFKQKEKAIKLEIEKGKEEILLFAEQIQKAEIVSAELEYKINNAIASETLYTFIDERSKSDDYKKHLGIISIIRKDFEILNSLFIGHNKEIAHQIDVEIFRKYFKKPVERIILYIDDLDRCPEENVVQVLEAVNLLMAFPLFIVIVGVDPRWVKNALIKKHTLQFRGILNGDGNGVEQIEPSNYLEKIFQIPFHLKDAGPQNVKEMIRQLATTNPAYKSDINNALADDGTFLTEKDDSLLINEDGTFLVAEQSDAVAIEDELSIQIHENIDFIVLSEMEIELLQDMGEIIGPNPRAIKRFVNVFKVVKAHEDYGLANNEDRRELLTILFILALSTGQFRCLIPSFEKYIYTPDNENRQMTFYLQNISNDIEYKNELNELDVILSNNINYHTLKNIEARLFRQHNHFIKRFTFKNI